MLNQLQKVVWHLFRTNLYWNLFSGLGAYIQHLITLQLEYAVMMLS